MKEKVKGFIAHPLFSGSAIMVVGSNLTNAIAYVYHLVIGRMLGPAAYSELAATVSALTLFTASFSFLGLVIVKFVSGAKDDEERGQLYSWLIRKVFVLGVVLMVTSLVLTPILVNFLHLETKIVLLIGPSIFVFLLGFVYRSFLQGLLKFTQTVVISNIDLITRLVLGVVFVYLGLSAFGAVLGIFIGALLSLILGIQFLKKFKISSKKMFTGRADIIKFALPVFLVTIATTSFISADVILVKHYFDPHDAGIYASLSTLGKIIFYGASPVAAVMFPMVSQRHSKGQGYSKILMMSLALTVLISSFVILIYYFFPRESVQLLYGDEFLDASAYLIWFGLFMGTFVIANLIISFYLSLNKSVIAFFPPIFAVSQILGIVLFHSSIYQVIKVSFIAVAFMLGCLLIYTGFDNRKSAWKKI